ncbi:MAG: hypothetical protein JWR59_736 [Brevundimonas sp.]|nr:hypothetical protein [Brevundimonas sp.]
MRLGGDRLGVFFNCHFQKSGVDAWICDHRRQMAVVASLGSQGGTALMLELRPASSEGST